MAYNARGLVTIAIGANRPGATSAERARQIHHYSTDDDTVATLIAAGYFNSARDLIKPGDIILCSLNLDATPVGTSLICTASPSTGNVTTAVFVFA